MVHVELEPWAKYTHTLIPPLYETLLFMLLAKNLWTLPKQNSIYVHP
jgi:hypothetical protein